MVVSLIYLYSRNFSKKECFKNSPVNILQKLGKSLFFGKKLLKGGHTLLFAMHKCGNTKEECPPWFLSFKNPSFCQK